MPFFFRYVCPLVMPTYYLKWSYIFSRVSGPLSLCRIGHGQKFKHEARNSTLTSASGKEKKGVEERNEGYFPQGAKISREEGRISVDVKPEYVRRGATA